MIRHKQVVVNYLKYRVLSSHRRGHGIHSPFVFNLVTGVFRNKTDPDIVCSVEKLRKKMLADTRKLQVTDYGSGSVQIKGNLRKISSIARYSSVPQKYGKLLAQLAAEFGGKDIIELGTSLGISTLYLSALTKARVHTIEGSSALAETAAGYFREAGRDNIIQHTGKFDDVLTCLKEMRITPGLVFIDGDHRKDALIRYFSTAAGMCSSAGVVVIDDIHHSPEMNEAWKEIRMMRNVSITVDICRMGIVFFRTGIAKYDYTIRY